ISDASPAVDSSAPGRSRRPVRRGGSVTKRGANTTTASPIGTLMNSTHRHDPPEVKTPPRIRPSDPAPADTPAKIASALLRARPSLKVAAINATVLGAAIAAPRSEEHT